MTAVLDPVHVVELRAASRGPRSRGLLATVGREVGTVAGLLVVWQLLVHLTLTRSAGAHSAGLAIWHAEQATGLDVEPAVQRLAASVPGVVAGANVFYEAAQWLSLAAVLVWAAWQVGPAAYRRLRWYVVATTIGAWAVQAAWPVAPLRLLNVGVVDTAAAAGTSVYTDQHLVPVGVYSAMPSIHVAWAFVLGFALYGWGRGAVRLAGPALLAATVLDVIVTGNHSVLDVLAGGALGAGAVGLVDLAATRRHGRPAC